MKNNIKKILTAGGYGYGNTGDEAQCSADLKLLRERYPDFQIVNLTPNVEYSQKQHPDFLHKYASRVVFFNHSRKHNYFDGLDSHLIQILFLLKSFWIFFNALLIKINFPILFINSEISEFLQELKESSLLYFCGGGYLTGATRSRLWDGILLCRLAHLFKVPVVMSGQTIGIWQNNFNKLYAKWGFKYVNIITVRDEAFSLKDLKEIGLEGENYFATHDDALFCEKSYERQINSQNYITLNFHYWGMNDREQETNMEKIRQIIDYIIDTTDYEIIFIPMIKSDEKSYNDYANKYPNSRLSSFKYDYDFRKVRRVIADSKICITMKHHPIIFSVGENVPVLSLSFSEYYLHKNTGALSQYGIEEYLVNMSKEDFLGRFKILFNKIIENQNEIKTRIEKKKQELKINKTKFLEKVDTILKVEK